VDDFERYGRKQSWLILRYRFFPRICLKRLRKTMGILRIAGLRAGFKKPEPPDYEAAIFIEHRTGISS
jgi:hypothetical protein